MCRGRSSLLRLENRRYKSQAVKTPAVSARVTPRYTFQFRDASSWNRFADHIDYSRSANCPPIFKEGTVGFGFKVFTVTRVDGRKRRVSTVMVFIVSLSLAASVAT